MRTWAWAVPAVLGLALMILSFDRLLRADPERPGRMGSCVLAGRGSQTVGRGNSHFDSVAVSARKCLGPGHAHGVGGAAPRSKMSWKPGCVPSSSSFPSMRYPAGEKAA